MFYIPYNPQTDPNALLAQGLAGVVGGLNQGWQRNRISNWAGSINQNMTPMEIFRSGLQNKIDPQFAMGIGNMMMRSRLSPHQMISQAKWNVIDKEMQAGNYDEANRLLFGNKKTEEELLFDDLRKWQTVQNTAAGQYYAPGLEGGATAPKNQKLYDLASKRIKDILAVMEEKGIEPPTLAETSSGKTKGHSEQSGKTDKENRVNNFIQDTITGLPGGKTKLIDSMKKPESAEEYFANYNSIKDARAKKEYENRWGNSVKSPYEDYPDAFIENGVWKVIVNGQKYRLED